MLEKKARHQHCTFTVPEINNTLIFIIKHLKTLLSLLLNFFMCISNWHMVLI